MNLNFFKKPKSVAYEPKKYKVSLILRFFENGDIHQITTTKTCETKEGVLEELKNGNDRIKKIRDDLNDPLSEYLYVDGLTLIRKTNFASAQQIHDPI